MEMGFAVPAPAIFPGIAEESGRGRHGRGVLGAGRAVTRSTGQKEREQHGLDCSHANLDLSHLCPRAHTSHGPVGATQAFTRNADGVEGDP